MRGEGAVVRVSPFNGNTYSVHSSTTLTRFHLLVFMALSAISLLSTTSVGFPVKNHKYGTMHTLP